MKPKGLLFKSEMIRALLNTQIDSWPAKPVDESQPWKWQTRRLIGPQPHQVALPSGKAEGLVRLRATDDCLSTWSSAATYPVGSILYAKETHIPKASGVIYKADFDSVEAAGLSGMYGGWKSSIFMKMIYARLWFRVMNVRVERVNEISELDAFAEGCAPAPSKQYDIFAYTKGYAKLWDSINGHGDFDKGNYVWVYDLQRITKPV